MKKLILIIFLLISVHNYLPHAQWLQTNDLNNFGISSITSIDRNVFAGTTGEGIFVTTNDGASWQAQNDNIADLSIRKLTSSGQNLAALNSSQILVSTNNGTNWIQRGDGCSTIAMFGNIIYVGKDIGQLNSPSPIIENRDKLHGLYRSFNLGSGWSWVNESEEIFAVAVDSGIVIASDYVATVISYDYGQSWQVADNGLANANNINCFYFFHGNIFAGSSSGVYFTSNNGSNWMQVNSGLNDFNIHCFASFNDTIYTANDSGVFKSANMGQNWIDISQGLSTANKVTSLSVNGYYIFAGTNYSGVWKRPVVKITGINLSNGGIPNEFSLSQNYPNPFNPTTKIKFTTPLNPPEGGTHVQLIIYDILGREVTTLVNGKLNPGTYEVKWNATNSPSGVYFYKLSATGGTTVFTKTMKMILMK